MTNANEQLLLSVIVPVYNVEEYLLECLDSINRSIANINAEVLLIDDGSTDSSGEIAKAYLADHDKFRYFHKENGGLSHTRNYGAKRAKGKYISFIDSDDVISEDMYETMIASAEYHDTDFAIINLARFNSKRTYPSTLYGLVFRDLDKTVTHISECDSLIYDTIACNKLIRRSFWEENKFEFPVGWRFEDMAVSLAMHCKARRVSIVRTVGYLWRARDGETKSITQENSSIINLKHRIEMLERMYSYINGELGGDERLRQLLSKKILSVDLILYLNEIGTLSRETQEEYREVITDFFDRHYTETDLLQLNAVNRQQYTDLFAKRYDELDPLCYYGKNFYQTAPVVSDDGFYIQPSGELFDEKKHDIRNEYESVDPVTSIMDLGASDDGLWIDMYCYLNRISIREGDQTIRAKLLNVVTGKEKDLSVESIDGKDVSAKYGRLYDLYTGKGYDYNYDGAAFRATIDVNDIEDIEAFSGNNVLVIDYSNPVKSGSCFVRVKEDWVIRKYGGYVFGFDDSNIELSFDAQGCFVPALRKRETATPEAERGGNSPACVTDIRKSDDHTIELKVADDRISGNERDAVLALEYYDRIAGRPVVLADTASTENGTAAFKVDLSEKEILENLYDMYAPLYLRAQGKTETYPIAIGRTLRARVDIDGLEIRLLGDCSDHLRIDVRKKDYLNGNIKKYNRRFCYPQYQKEPIDNKTIFFESHMGTQYSCNPRALYEYIDENHPEYTCVWSFVDERTPINGRGIRVRKYSEEYYRYLATAKFFVNNDNLELSYKKRVGQIEVQTMSGTPCKKVGLDYAGAFRSEKDKLDFIRKNKRWNYLIAQGKLTEDNANKWYGFDKKYLRTGYPRTDQLLGVAPEDQDRIRRSLGLPEDKKIILYAPTSREEGQYDMPLDLEYVREKLADDYVLLVRPHRDALEAYSVPEDRRFIFDAGSYDSIENLYKIADVMITDYSSAMFDFALTGKPLVLFIYDLEQYKETRGLYFDICKEVPARIAADTEEAVKEILAASEKPDERAKLFKEKYLTYECDDSCEKVFKNVIQNQKNNRVLSMRLGIMKVAKAIIPAKVYSSIRKQKLKKDLR